MQRYKLAALAKGQKRTSVVLPAVMPALGPQREYLAVLRAMLRELSRETRETIVPLAVDEISRNKAMMRDAEPSWFDRLIALSVRLGIVAEQTVVRILGLEAARHSDRFMASAKRALGVDLAAVVRNEDLAEYLRTSATRNAALIKGLADETVKRVQQVVTTAVINGQPATVLRKTLTEQFQIADRRAQLIARDQISKLTSDLNRIRHEQAGITTYTWRTSADERVRPRHRALEGKVYKYGEATGAEGGLPPGQPIRCRCVAAAIVEF